MKCLDLVLWEGCDAHNTKGVTAAWHVREAGSCGMITMSSEVCSCCLGLHQPPLEMLITECTLICVNYANQAAVAHCCGLGGSHAVLTVSHWTDTGFIHYNKWFCCRVFERQVVAVVGCR